MSRDAVTAKTNSTKLIPGFYGKLPIRGDFVSRHLPRAFTDTWDWHWTLESLDRLDAADWSQRSWDEKPLFAEGKPANLPITEDSL